MSLYLQADRMLTLGIDTFCQPGFNESTKFIIHLKQLILHIVYKQRHDIADYPIVCSQMISHYMIKSNDKIILKWEPTAKPHALRVRADDSQVIDHISNINLFPLWKGSHTLSWILTTFHNRIKTYVIDFIYHCHLYNTTCTDLSYNTLCYRTFWDESGFWVLCNSDASIASKHFV